MKKIGFIDYFLDEWHANNYPVWIRDKRYRGAYDVTFAWAAKDKPGGLTTAQWCEKMGVRMMASQEELIEASDCLVVLAPDHPEQHEVLARLALASGKPTYVDKTFAPDLAAACRLFDQARASGTPMYSTSALRYARELSWLKDQEARQEDVSFVSARGPGSFNSYAIHQLEMIIVAMGPGAVRAIAAGTPEVPLVIYTYSDGRSCVVNHLPWSGFSLALQTKKGQGANLAVNEDFWQPFTADLLRFFETGQPPVPRRETCAAIAMVEAGRKALASPGQWIDVPQISPV